jgi:type II secretory pathway pseudopilin PulG
MQPHRSSERGFTMIEMLVATAISIAVLGAVLAIVRPVPMVLRTESERGDLHQRLRAATDALASSLRVCLSVRPYRIGAVGDDGAAGVFYRPDAIAVVGDTTETYYLKPATRQLMRYDGDHSDLPVVDHVVELSVDYFGPVAEPGSPLVSIEPAMLVDGPWSEDASHRFFDTDVLRIAEVRVGIRFEATASLLRRLVPDEQLVLHVALRNSSFAR